MRALSVILLLLLLAACKSSPTATDTSGPPCGAVCGGAGLVTIFVTNPTSDTVRIAWWWRGARGDSGRVVPGSPGQCFRFTASTWAQFQGFYGPASGDTLTGGDYLADAFDPVAGPRWKVDARPGTPRTVHPYGNYGFVVTQPAVGC